MLDGFMEKKAKKVLENWDIGKIKKIKLSKKGVVNYNWLVETSNGKYFLRKFMMNRKFSDLKFEISYLRKLNCADFGYKTPNPLQTIKNKFFVKLNGKYFWLDNFIEGKIKKEFGKVELKETAKMLSRHHDILEKLKIKSLKKDNDDFSRKDILDEMKGFINKLNKKKTLKNEEKTYLNETEKLIPILNELNVREYSKLKKYAVHRDLNPENILWKGNKISGVLDFENVAFSNDCFVKDICVVLQYACSDEKHRLNFKKTRYLLKEYQKCRKISKKEIELIPEILSAAYIEDFEYQYWKVENDKKRATPQRLRLYSMASQWHWENKTKIVEELL